jgi:hypothetical protein
MNRPLCCYDYISESLRREIPKFDANMLERMVRTGGR